MISKLLYKELRLAGHPSLFIFSLMGILVLAPGYPYMMIFLFACIGNFVNALYARETNDIYFTALLPLKKVDTVTSKMSVLLASQIFSLLITIPFAFLRLLYLHDTGNPVGIEANIAFFGAGLIIYAVFNYSFLTIYFKTAYQVGKAVIIAGIPAVIIAVMVEALSHFPQLSWLDSVAPADLITQLPILIIGMILYILSAYLTKKVASKNFLQVNL